MTIHQILTSVGEQFAGLAEGLRPDAPLEWLQARHDRLGSDLRRRYELLVSQRAVIQGLRHRLDVGERRAAALAERAEVFLHLCDGDNAWKHALELDRPAPPWSANANHSPATRKATPSNAMTSMHSRSRWQTCASAWNGVSDGVRSLLALSFTSLAS